MSEHIDVDDKMPTTVKQDLVRLDTVFENTNLSRDAIASKLKSVIDVMEITTEDPKLMTAQMNVIDKYLSVLNGTESNIARRVASKLKQAENETSSKHSAAVADLLSKISVNNVNLSLGTSLLSSDELERQIEEAYASSGLDPILTTELKTDPNDLQT